MDSVLARPKRLVTLRRNGGDFVVAFYSEDLVVFRHNEAKPLRKMCAFLRWKIISEVRKPDEAGAYVIWLSGLFQLLQKEPGTVIGDLLSVRQLMGLQVMKEIIAAVRQAIPDAANRPAGAVLEHVLSALRAWDANV